MKKAEERNRNCVVQLIFLRPLISVFDPPIDPPGVNKDPGFLGAEPASGTAATSPVGLTTGAAAGVVTTASGVLGGAATPAAAGVAGTACCCCPNNPDKIPPGRRRGLFGLWKKG
jgi:hypothetical protein